MAETDELTDEQLKRIAEHLADALESKQGGGCSFTAAEREDLRSLLKTKKRAAAAVLWAAGAVFLWIFKSAFEWILKHLNFTWSGS